MEKPKAMPAPDRDRLLEKARAALGWNELKEALSLRAESMPGKASCREPDLASGAPQAEIALIETGEMLALFQAGNTPPGTAFEDVAPLVAKAQAEGVLEPPDLVKIMELLRQASRAATFYKASAEGTRIGEWAARLDPQKTLMKKLENSIDPDGSVLDGASPELASLRSEHRVLRYRIVRRLNKIVTSNPDTVLQDSFYTQRGERYVVPIKASEQSRFEGIVHHASASGQTVFVEPAELVEPNNRLKLVEAKIEEEIIRILRDLSARVGEGADAIMTDQSVLSHLDAARARARLAVDMDAMRPRVNDRGRVKITRARHPLLALRGVEVVPNDVELGDDFKVLLISGPNTGGKTVGLTMVGLFALMARAGMFIPAGDDSEMGVFTEVYAMIGDEQNLALDLSSFSAHLLDLIGIIKAAGPRSLILIDELMNSTDPEQGSALAAAILSALRDRGAAVAATTHLPGLKSFAHEAQGFMNAGFSFDPDTLEPTYRLVIGVPGQSLGIDIASRLGLGRDLVERAKAETDSSSRRLESLLGELSRKIETAEAEREALDVERRRVKDLAEEYRGLRDRVREEDLKLRRSVKAEVRKALRKAEDEIKSLMEPVRTAERVGREKALGVRRGLRDLGEKVEQEYGEGDLAPGEALDWSKVKKGDRVLVMPLLVEAEIMEDPPAEVDDNTEIKARIGKLTVRLEAGKIRLPEKDEGRDRESPGIKLKKAPRRKKRDKEAAQEDQGYSRDPLLGPSADNTLDLRGMRVHEAEPMVEDFLDRSCRDSRRSVYIIHGHGTGALKQVVREMLALSPYVENFRPGEKGEGGDGVTMVELKDLGGYVG